MAKIRILCTVAGNDFAFRAGQEVGDDTVALSVLEELVRAGHAEWVEVSTVDTSTEVTKVEKRKK